MLSFAAASSSTKTLTPNILPCSIKHSGPIKIPKRYWDPQTTVDKPNKKPKTAPEQPEQCEQSDQADQTSQLSQSPPSPKKSETAYLRGRKLLGRTLPLPAGYTGIVMQKTEDSLPVPATAPDPRIDIDDKDEDGNEGEEEEAIDIKIMKPEAVFREIIVWGHEVIPEDDDPYVKSVEEWIGFAEAASSR